MGRARAGYKQSCFAGTGNEVILGVEREPEPLYAVPYRGMMLALPKWATENKEFMSLIDDENDDYAETEAILRRLFQ